MTASDSLSLLFAEIIGKVSFVVELAVWVRIDLFKNIYEGDFNKYFCEFLFNNLKRCKMNKLLLLLVSIFLPLLGGCPNAPSHKFAMEGVAFNLNGTLTLKTNTDVLTVSNQRTAETVHKDYRFPPASGRSPVEILIQPENQICRVIPGSDYFDFFGFEINFQCDDVTYIYTVSTLAGSTSGQAGMTNSANGIDARFESPVGIGADTSGNLFVSDSANTLLRKITSAGAVTTFATGFTSPTLLAVKANGDVLVVEKTTKQIVSVSASGNKSVFANGLVAPAGVAVDASGAVYVSDERVIKKFAADGTTMTILAGTLGSSGSDDGQGAAARFRSPAGLAVDSNGNVYVADNVHSTVRKITPTGLVSTLAGLAGSDVGLVNGTGSIARFKYPSAVATDVYGNVYVADSYNNAIRKITPAGVVTTLSGISDPPGRQDGAASVATFNNPVGITIDANRTIFVTDSANNSVRKLTLQVAK